MCRITKERSLTTSLFSTSHSIFVTVMKLFITVVVNCFCLLLKDKKGPRRVQLYSPWTTFRMLLSSISAMMSCAPRMPMCE